MLQYPPPPKVDNWFVHEVIEAGYREVIDASDAVTVVHVNHNYVTAGGAEVKVSNANSGSTFWQKRKTQDWQIFHNNHLAAVYGSYRNQDGTTVHAPWKLATCMEPSAGYMCLIKRIRPGLCPCEHGSFTLSTQNDPVIADVVEGGSPRRIVRCGGISKDTGSVDTYKIPVTTSEGHPPVYGLPFTLEDLLPLMARNNHVIVTGVSYGYRDMLMNYVCNLRRLGITHSLIIAAFDKEMYEFGFKMGLPIFFYEADDADVRKALSRGMEYGSKGFKKVTKLKSQVVLRILRMGYDVTWTDTDIVWLRDPLPALADMPSDFVVQSNAPWPEESAANGELRINSGFYRIRSNELTIAALETIVHHAAISKFTEQPSFYMVLCGGREGTLRVGDNKCSWRPASAAGVVNLGNGGSLPGAGTAEGPGRRSSDDAVDEPPTLIVEFLDR